VNELNLLQPADSVNDTRQPENHHRLKAPWLYDVLLILVLLSGIYFRFVGVNWDDYTHLHPDERFLTMVEASLSSVKSLSDYFNTATSSLNPNNRGYSFFVYGTFPLFIVRYVGELAGKTGYDQIHLIGRQLSAIADLITVFLVYLIGSRLYNRRVGLIGAALASFSVLPIQLSHYLTVDTFTNTFGILTIFIAVCILTDRKEFANSIFTPRPEIDEPIPSANQRIKALVLEFLPYVLFGVALGMAVASKINAVVVAGMLPLVVLIRYYKLPAQEREKRLLRIVIYMAVAAIVSLVVFRICQPYAFTGPGFFGVKLNPQWVQTMKDLSNQSSGDVDFPPALQWARRPLSFAWTNMVEWGMGIPFGVLAWAGFIWMGWRIIRKNDWTRHLPIWIWTGLYFAWQSLNWVRSMRYQMLIYPTLAIIAGWVIDQLWEKGSNGKLGLIAQTTGKRLNRFRIGWRILAVVVGLGVVLATGAWAFAFTRIYTRPLTRVAASEWIYQNVPGPVNLHISTGNEEINQPLAFRAGGTFLEDRPYPIAFTAQQDSSLIQVEISHLVDTQGTPGVKTTAVTIAEVASPEKVLGTAFLNDTLAAGDNLLGKAYQPAFIAPIPIHKGTSYLLNFMLVSGTGIFQVTGSVNLMLTDTSGNTVYQSLPAPVQVVLADSPYTNTFAPFHEGQLKELYLPGIVDQTASTRTKTLNVTISTLGPDGKEQLSSGTVSSTFPLTADGRGQGFTIPLDPPLQLVKNQAYALSFILSGDPGAIGIYGSAPALETSWDDALPQPIDGYSPYDMNGGIYQNDLNFEMYWDDNADKLKRFETTLDQANTIFISSNRQWGTTVRVPERYPLTAAYYRNLLGCPVDKEITWCFSVAEVGMFQGKLGYQLVGVFQSNPNLGPIRFNDQFAEEAFTVYDHPKVLIFKKETSYNPETVQSILGKVDLSTVVHVTPRKASALPKTLNLTPAQEAVQQAGGTWSDLFSRESLLNKYPGIGMIVWYLAVALLGLLAYPLVRTALPGLPDKGYPLARLTGMLVTSYLVWLAGSLNIPVTRTFISLVVLLLALVGGLLAYRQREGLKNEWSTRRKYFLAIEIIALVFFAADILIRLGNPDLWHPYKGGEKPMDFSYFNAVVKSTIYPPYDPWFGGGYLNYYYFGYVIVGILDKWLGIIPSIAYNLILPTLFSLVALGAFSLGWNLTHASEYLLRKGDPENSENKPGFFDLRFWIGLASSLGLLVMGNLGTVRMIWYGFQRLAAPGGNIDHATILTRYLWSFQGLGHFIAGQNLSFYPGDWYWIPSRAIPGEPITEFPFFTFLYADLHAHMIALSITLLVLAWALAFILGRAKWAKSGNRQDWISITACFLLGGVSIGALWPTNSWDYPTYLVLASLALVYTLWRYFNPSDKDWAGLGKSIRKWAVILAGLVALVGLSYLLYLPYIRLNGQGYNALDPWNGDRTPFWSYITHWGLFLFVILSWMVWETYHWMATTPMSALNKLRPYISWIVFILVFLIAITGVMVFILQVEIAWFVILLGVWTVILIFRPGQSDAKIAVLFMIGTGLAITLFVEFFMLRGDLGRMNIVFKFYYQVWTLFAISAAACLGWIFKGWPTWSRGWGNAWAVSFMVLVAGAALFPIMATNDKVNDRMAKDAPHTLDGMTYMAYSQYNDQGTILDLSPDYKAIQWVQNNVIGSPIIVEGNTPEYRWGTRFTIYTGLPGVVGWNYHQRQQRAVLSSTVVTDRIAAITDFYTTTSQDVAEVFLKKYDVSYVIVGELEWANYQVNGLLKFDALNGILWKAVYRDGKTVIYQVIK